MLTTHISLAPSIFHANMVLLTNPHHNQEPCHEPPQLDHAVPASGVHEIILVSCFAAEPVGNGSDAVGCNDEEGKIVLEER